MRDKGVDSANKGKILETKKRNESLVRNISVRGSWLGGEPQLGDEGTTVEELEHSAIKDLKGNFLRSITSPTKEESKRVNKSYLVVRWTAVASVRTVFSTSENSCYVY